MAVAVKIRSAPGPVPATLFGKPDGGGEVPLDTPERAVALGQAGVFYADTRVQRRLHLPRRLTFAPAGMYRRRFRSIYMKDLAEKP